MTDTYLSFLVFSSCMRLWFSAASVFDLILTMVSEVSFFICSKNPTHVIHNNQSYLEPLQS
jgi:hypothetical protein